MPRQIFDAQSVLSMIDKAKKIIVVKRGETVKIKLRMSRYLYTYVATPEEAEKILSTVKDKDKVVNV